MENHSRLYYSPTLMQKSRSFPTALLLEDGKTISPKNVMEEFWKRINQFIKDFHSDTCEISFSLVEKEILNRHRSAKACHRYRMKDCCKKECLKMLDDLVDALKMK